MKTHLFFTVIMIALVATINAQIPTNGLVGYWPFNGNANDESGNAHNGTVNGATLTNDRFGNENSAYFFNGNSSISLNSSFELSETASITLSGWIYPTESKYGFIFDRTTNTSSVFSLAIREDSTLEFFVRYGNNFENGTTIVSTEKLLLNNWYHIVLQRDYSLKLNLYINGILNKSVDDVSDNLSFPIMKIGNHAYESIVFPGKIDDIRIYDRALNTSEIVSLNNEGRCFETVYDTTFVTIYDTIKVYQNISVTDTLIIDVALTDINSSENTNTLKVYPNPAKNFIYVNTGSKYEQMTDYYIKIINTDGSVVFESTVNQQLFEIDVNDFGQTGLYFIQIIDNSNQIIDTRKILLK